MAYQPEWLTLAEAVDLIQSFGEASPSQALRRAGQDGRLQTRGMSGESLLSIAVLWWTDATIIDFDSGCMGIPMSTRKPPLPPIKRDDFLPGNFVHAVQIHGPSLVKLWGGHSFEDASVQSLDRDVLSRWAMVDTLTIEQAACLWSGVDPAKNKYKRTEEEASRFAPVIQLLSASAKSGQLAVDGSENVIASMDDHAASLVRRDDLMKLARAKGERPAFLFDTFMGVEASDPAANDGVLDKRKVGRPREYDWDSLTVEIIRIADLDGLPEKQAELTGLLLQWCENRWNRQPAESAVKKLVSSIYNGLGRGQKSRDDSAS